MRPRQFGCRAPKDLPWKTWTHSHGPSWVDWRHPLPHPRPVHPSIFTLPVVDSDRQKETKQ